MADGLTNTERLAAERNLAESYPVRRSSTREVFRMLESQGLITYVSPGTFFVADFTDRLHQRSPC